MNKKVFKNFDKGINSLIRESIVSSSTVLHVEHIAINIDNTLRLSPLSGLSYFDGQIFYRKKIG